mmetsp:Transcript_6480/g.6377  ORF Transcript_6480/g.6377 Transcript_6480/m.6377 type:complete len:275 (-) Transcript_6480:166-990(-)
MSNCSDIPTHVVFSSTVIIRTTDKDEDGVVHGCVVNDADDDDLSSIDDVSCMSEDNASLEHIRVGLYNFVIESTYNDLEDFGPPLVAVSTATKDGTGVDNNDNDNDDDYVSDKAITESTLLSSDLISVPTLSPTRKIAATVEHRRRAPFSLEGNISIRRATAIRITRGESFEVTLPPSCVRKCNNGEDALKSAAIQAVTDNSHIFTFDNLVKNAIREKKKVVRYEFLGQNPTSSQFKLLSMEDILLGDDNTVLIKMSINDVKGHGKVTLGESLF